VLCRVENIISRSAVKHLGLLTGYSAHKKAPHERGCVLSPTGYIYDLSAIAIKTGLHIVMSKGAIDEFVNLFIAL